MRRIEAKKVKNVTGNRKNWENYFKVNLNILHTYLKGIFNIIKKILEKSLFYKFIDNLILWTLIHGPFDNDRFEFHISTISCNSPSD